MLPQRPIPETDTALMTLVAITHADVPELGERLRVLVGASDADVVVCDVGDLVTDLVAVEALARLRLTAGRLGCGLRLRHASRALEQMLAFCGLCDVLPVEEELGAGAGRDGGKPEEREHPGCVEKRVDRGDAPV